MKAKTYLKKQNKTLISVKLKVLRIIWNPWKMVLVSDGWVCEIIGRLKGGSKSNICFSRKNTSLLCRWSQIKSIIDTSDWRLSLYAASCNCKSVFVHLPMRNNRCPSQNLTYHEATGTPGITVQWFPQRELNLRIIYSLHDKKNRTKIDEYFSWPELERSLRGGYPWPSFLHQSSSCWPSAGCCRNCTSHSSIRLKSSRGSVDIWVSFNGQETKELSIWKETHTNTW